MHGNEWRKSNGILAKNIFWRSKYNKCSAERRQMGMADCMNSNVLNTLEQNNHLYWSLFTYCLNVSLQETSSKKMLKLYFVKFNSIEHQNLDLVEIIWPSRNQKTRQTSRQRELYSLYYCHDIAYKFHDSSKVQDNISDGSILHS